MVEKQPHDLLIHSQDLSWGYPWSPKLVFHKLNFWLYKNDFAVITWVSGSGKSTLAKLILGQYQTKRKMLFHGHEDMSRFSDSELQKFRRRIGVIFQDFKLIEWKTVTENVIYPLTIMWHTPLNKMTKLNKILKRLGLHNHKNTIVKYLSWGEKQKVAIARALIHDPEFIIADEPTWNVDNDEKNKIADILIDLHKLGHTVMFITHDTYLKKYIQKKTTISSLQLEKA